MAKKMQWPNCTLVKRKVIDGKRELFEGKK
jgi:hypothetical protein